MPIQFREVIEADKQIIQSWIDSDPEHSNKEMTSDFFFMENTKSLVLFDKDGPGIYVRIDPQAPDSCVRLHIQFSPNETRSAKTLLKGWPTFMDRIRAAGIDRIVFESVSPRLIGFCKRVFKFTPIKDTNDYELILGRS